jgi:hypothetical protein
MPMMMILSMRKDSMGEFTLPRMLQAIRRLASARYDDDNRRISAASLLKRQFRMATRRTQGDALSRFRP